MVKREYLALIFDSEVVLGLRFQDWLYYSRLEEVDKVKIDLAALIANNGAGVIPFFTNLEIIMQTNLAMIGLIPTHTTKFVLERSKIAWCL